MPTPSPHATQKSSVCLRQLNQPFLRILKPSITERLLGVTLDTKLRWKKKDYIDAIARLGGATWGRKGEGGGRGGGWGWTGILLPLRQLHRGVVAPQMSYACILWYIPLSEKKKRHRKSYFQMSEYRLFRVRGALGATTPMALNIQEVHSYLSPFLSLTREISGRCHSKAGNGCYIASKRSFNSFNSNQGRKLKRLTSWKF